jgi:hypothetical protein
MFKNIHVNCCQRRWGSFAIGEGDCHDQLISALLSIFSAEDIPCTRQTSPFMRAKANLVVMQGETPKVVSDVFRVVLVWSA